MLEDYCRLNILRDNGGKDIIVNSGEEYYIPMLPQIISLSKEINVVFKNNIRCIIGLDGTRYCEDKDGDIVVPRKGILRCSWKPLIDVVRLSKLLTYLGVIKEGDSKVLFNPFPYPTCIPYSNTLFCIEAFTGKRIEYDIIEKSVEKISLGTKWVVNIERRSLSFRSKEIEELAFKIDLYNTPKLLYDEVNNNHILLGNGYSIIMNSRRGIVYLNIYNDVYMETNLKGCYGKILNPYYVYNQYIEENSFDTTSSWILFGEPVNIGLINPLNKRIIFGKKFFLEKGLYMMIFSDKINYGVIHNNMLGLLVAIHSIKHVILYGDLIDYNRFMLRIYPFKSLVGDYRVEDNGLVFTLFNPHNEVSLIEYYSVFPFKKIMVYNSRYIDGYKPVLLKPNIARISLHPWEIALIDSRFESIPSKTLKYMMFLRGKFP